MNAYLAGVLLGLVLLATIYITGRGLGGRLLHACEAGMGMPKVKLSVRESNQAAIEMYQRYGYRQVGMWKRYYKGGENGIVMEKVLGRNLVR